MENNIVIPEDWKYYIHHMTIAFNNGSPEVENLYNIYKDDFGTNERLTVDGIGVSDDAIAVRTKWVGPIANKIPHITVATPPNGKPVNSNNIVKWVDVKPITLYGKLGCFKNK